jgi:hypothetical protein
LQDSHDSFKVSYNFLEISSNSSIIFLKLK